MDWPIRESCRTVRGSTIRKWESRQPALGPVHFQLSGTDSVQRLVISVGSSDPAGDRCWCEIKAPFDDTVVIELGHNRLGRPNDVCVAVLPALRPERLLQAQWWNKRLQVFLDGHRIGMLSLQDCDVQQWAKVTISLFGADDSPSEPSRTSSCFMPTEMGTGFFLDSADLCGGAAELLTIIPLQTSWLGSLDDFLSLATCSPDLRESVQHSNFWHDVELKLSDRLRVSFRQTSFFGNLLQAWAQGIRTLSCSHKLLHVVSVLGNKVIYSAGEENIFLVWWLRLLIRRRQGSPIGDRRSRHAGRCPWRFLFRRKLGSWWWPFVVLHTSVPQTTAPA